MSLEAARSNIEGLMQRVSTSMGGGFTPEHQNFAVSLIGAESSFGTNKVNDDNPNVYGIGQFYEDTFDRTIRNLRQNGTPQQKALADKAAALGWRNDEAQAIATYAYSIENAEILSNKSIAISPISLSAMHLLGGNAGPIVLAQDDNVLISSIDFPNKNNVIAGNREILGGTVGEMKAEFEQRLRNRGHQNPREILAFKPDRNLYSDGRNMSYTAVASMSGVSASHSGISMAGLSQGAEEAWNATTGAVSGAASWLTAGSLQNSQGEWFKDESGEPDWKKGLGAGALLILFFAALDWAKEKTGLLLGLIAGVAIMAFAAFGGSRLFGVGTAHAAEPNPLPGHGTGAPVPQRGDGVKPLELPEELRNTNVSGGTDLPNHQRVDPNAPHRPASDGIDGLSLPG